MKTQRTITVIVLACLLTSLSILVGLIVWLGPTVGAGIGLVVGSSVVGLYLAVVGPWQRHWGATQDEVRRQMPGDDLLRAGAPTTTRAVTIEAPPEDVFPWLLQIGYGRGGWYSYDWIDNDGRPSVDRIDPDLQELTVGDRIEMLPGVGPVVRAIERDRYLLSGGDADSWCLMVLPAAGGGTRLISRWRQEWPKGAATRVWMTITDPGAFVMEQKMLRTLRARAERTRPG